jgi:hypothetical protein
MNTIPLSTILQVANALGQAQRELMREGSSNGLRLGTIEDLAGASCSPPSAVDAEVNAVSARQPLGARCIETLLTEEDVQLVLPDGPKIEATLRTYGDFDSDYGGVRVERATLRRPVRPRGGHPDVGLAGRRAVAPGARAVAWESTPSRSSP